MCLDVAALRGKPSQESVLIFIGLKAISVTAKNSGAIPILASEAFSRILIAV